MERSTSDSVRTLRSQKGERAHLTRFRGRKYGAWITHIRLLVGNDQVGLIRRMELEQADIEGALGHQGLQRLFGQKA